MEVIYVWFLYSSKNKKFLREYAPLKPGADEQFLFEQLGSDGVIANRGRSRLRGVRLHVGTTGVRPIVWYLACLIFSPPSDIQITFRPSSVVRQ